MLFRSSRGECKPQAHVSEHGRALVSDRLVRRKADGLGGADDRAALVEGEDVCEEERVRHAGDLVACDWRGGGGREWGEGRGRGEQECGVVVGRQAGWAGSVLD